MNSKEIAIMKTLSTKEQVTWCSTPTSQTKCLYIENSEDSTRKISFYFYKVLVIASRAHLVGPYAAAAAAKSLQSCPILCDPIDGSPLGYAIPWILQARTLEWVAILFSSAWKWKVKGSHSVLSDSSQPRGLQPTRLLHPWDFPEKSTGVGCHCFLQVWHYK